MPPRPRVPQQRRSPSRSEPPAIVTVRGLCFAHGERKIFDGVDLRIARG